MGRDNTAYHVRATDGVQHLDNPAHSVRADLTAQGIELRAGSARLGLRLTAYGYDGALSPVRMADPRAEANRVEYRRGDLTEWYINGPLGLEQGFTLAAPPRSRTERSMGQPLTLALDISGDLRARLDEDGRAVAFHTGAGEAMLRYRGLIAYDAAGKDLHAWLEVAGNHVRLCVDDTGARYPLVVDPFIQQAELTASDGAAGDDFGAAVAISGDTVVVGAIADTIGAHASQGSAYVFVKPVAGWATMSETAKLTASDGAASDLFGAAVAISGDTVVVGAIVDDIGANSNQGSAYVFVKPVAGWATMTETAKLTASDGAASDLFGAAVAISSDTVVVGAYADDIGANSDQGSTYVFVKPVAGWATMTQTAKLTASDGAASDLFGYAVAISGDTVVVGAAVDDIGANSDQGSAYVFVKPVAGWATMTETAKLTASDGAAGDEVGYAVAISGDTVVVGAALDDIGANSDQGSAYVFVKPVAGWATMTETAKLTASDGATSDFFGYTTAISGDTMVVGAAVDDIGANSDQGSAYMFLKPVAGWTTMTETGKLTASDGAAGDEFGYAVAISGDTVVVGAIGNDIGANAEQGSAYVFVADTPTPTATPTSTSTATPTRR